MIPVIISLLGLAFLVYFVWPRRDVRNIIVSARQKKRQRMLDGLPVAELTKRAVAGDSSAQYRLGYLYATGAGVPMDHSVASRWLARAAEAGIVEAQYCLGIHYERGRGVPIDYARALELYTAAANAGNADAQCNLGMLFLKGVGVEANVVKAIRWFVRAMAQGHQQASKNLDWVVENREALHAREITETGEIDVLAEHDHADALLVLGWMHAVGFARRPDRSAARRCFERAQRLGDLFAHVLLAQLESGKFDDSCAGTAVEN